MDIIDKLKNSMYDPVTTQNIILTEIEDRLGGRAGLVDATSPFAMLTEMISTTSTNNVNEIMSSLTDFYPLMALDKETLFKHLTKETFKLAFATPAKVSIILKVSLLELMENGTVENNIIKTIIPKYTEIEALGVTLTLLNPIVIYLDNNITYVEQLKSDLLNINNGLGNLKSTNYTDEDNNKWIVFEALFTQTKRIYKEITLLTGNSFKVDFDLQDRYWYSEVSNKSTLTNDEWVNIPISYTDINLNRDIPTIYAKYGVDNISFSLPLSYVLDNKLKEHLRIELFETKGNITLPLHKLHTDEFKIKLNKDYEDDMGINNISIKAFSLNLLDGGSNEKDVETLKQLAIYNRPNEFKTPITDKGILFKGMSEGFDIIKDTDTTRIREYVAFRDLPEVLSKNIDVDIETFIGSLGITLEEVISNSQTYFKDDFLIIYNNSFFKYNETIKLLTDSEIESINDLNINDKSIYLLENNIYFTPFTYVVDYKKMEIRTYVTDTPSIENLDILNKNVKLNVNVNIDNINIIEVKDGYKINITLIGNKPFEDMSKNNLYCEISFNNLDTTIYNYVKYDNGFEFLLETPKIVMGDEIELINFKSNLATELIKIEDACTFKIYTDELDVIGEYSDDVILDSDNLDRPVVLTTENISYKLVTELEFLYNFLHKNYTSNVYKKYTEDKPLFYTEDVWYVNTDSIYTAFKDEVSEETNNIDNIKYRPLFYKGDVVKDKYGNIVYEHRVGDYVKDEDGNFIIDEYANIKLFLDLLLLPIEYKLANNLNVLEALNLNLDLIKQWCLDNLDDMNEKMLENSIVRYKPRKKTNRINVKYKDEIKSINNIISPMVRLYVNDSDFKDKFDEYEIISNVGKIISKHFYKDVINFNLISDDIISKLKNGVVGCVIESDLDYMFTIQDVDNRLTLKNKIKNNTVMYDIEIAIHNV